MLLVDPKVALVTYTEQPELNDDDSLLREPLVQLGFVVEAVPWDSPTADWSAFQAVVLRSCWDYHYRSHEFRQWIERLNAEKVALWNRPQAVLWNINKIYLRDLAARGIRVIPTVWLEQGQSVDPSRILEQCGWESAVVKPAIGASAYEAWRITRPTVGMQSKLNQMLATTDVMVQKFVPEIVGGEWSLIFLGGAYSHAVVKLPQPGDIFVQPLLGGTWKAGHPAQSLIERASEIMQTVTRLASNDDQPLLYARVDGIEVGGEFLLMEVELIEPQLFLAAHVPDAAQTLANLILQAIRAT